MRRLVATIAVFAALAPVPILAATAQCTNAYTYPPKSYTYQLPPGTDNPGPNQHGTLRTNAAAAQADKGHTFFTLEMTSFNDAACSGGPCRNDIPGIAHRTWPLNSCVEVCNISTKRCANAVVMDKGPNTNLGCRTIDANPALQTALGMGSNGTVQATYKLVYLPGEGTCNTGVFANTNTAISPTDPVAQSLFYASGGTASMLNPYNQPLSLGGYQSQLGGLGSQAPYGLLNAMQQNPNAVSPVSAQLAQPVSPVQTPTGAQTQTPPVSTSRSALKLLVQPAVVRSGRTALLAWTSVGMQSGSCRVRTGSSSIANSNEGSRVSAQLFEGTTFVLECKDHTGATVASEAVVQVE